MIEIKEKIRKVYQKNGMGVEDKMIEHIINTPERLKGIIRLYKKEELESMNYIFGKTEDNKCFTKAELEAVQNIDLFDMNVVKICKKIWNNRKLEEGVV